jgi:hypothetical protein
MHFLFSLLRIKVLYMFGAFSVGAAKTVFAILRAFYVSWLHLALEICSGP